MVKAGMPPMDAIKAATHNAADLIGDTAGHRLGAAGPLRRHRRGRPATRWRTSPNWSG